MVDSRIVINLLSEAQVIIVFAGAGASVDFGLMTYWTGSDKKYAAESAVGQYTELEHSTYPFWEEDYPGNYAHHEARKARIEQAAYEHPENFYSLLKNFASAEGKALFLVTTNVDGYGRRFGIPDHRVLEVHGSVDFSQCFEDPTHGVFEGSDCKVCGGRVRPNTLMFQDFVFNPARLDEQTAYLSTFLDAHEEEAMLILEVGVGDTVPKLKNMEKKLAWETNSPVLQVNLEASELEDGSTAIYWPASTRDLTSILASL